MSTVRRRVLVSGHVQGVFFRDSTRRSAKVHDVSGWVCNRPDGRVEAVLEGSPEGVDRVLEFCRNGPRGAVVEDVEIHDEPPEGLGSFEVR
jgi:acylphosphatase